MRLTTVLAALAALSPLVAAHGRINVATGDADGNTTALGIQGGVAPGTGRNRPGPDHGGGKNTIDDLSRAVDLSGSTLPQVSSNGGTISVTYHVVTTDGAGPLQAMIDSTRTGQFSQGTPDEVVTQNKANGLLARLTKRAANVNQNFVRSSPEVQLGKALQRLPPRGRQHHRAGPFGGVVAFQIAQGAGGPPAPAPGAATPAAPATPAGNQLQGDGVAAPGNVEAQGAGNGRNAGTRGQNAKRFTA
ncbi:hypothetical protein TOPH_08007 [Tolypocladium ophioglossoides CBS 100239]|uniref:Uncharacterized protein n=1 Tax=Tolypocladium ophioglossoides (strain CBS 100239) TaxID=1163406 RepID=A0A0L0N0S5_TOLOC|nr:hypothetical protein TOPH_08007 [Tolypocladium ophioglossoides CBS 100239]